MVQDKPSSGTSKNTQPTEELLLFGNFSEMLSQLVNYLQTRKLLEDRDIGAWVGYPLLDYVRAKPLKRKLYLGSYSRKQPPYKAESGKIFKFASISVPEVKEEALTQWDVIKKILGGESGYTFGSHLTVVKYAKGGRQTHVYASTGKASRELAINLAGLSELKIDKVSTTFIEPVGQYAPGMPLAIKKVQVYPGFYYAMNSHDKVALKPETDKGTSTSTKTTEGEKIRKRLKKIPLWLNAPPSDLKERVKLMLKY